MLSFKCNYNLGIVQEIDVNNVQRPKISDTSEAMVSYQSYTYESLTFLNCPSLVLISRRGVGQTCTSLPFTLTLDLQIFTPRSQAFFT